MSDETKPNDENELGLLRNECFDQLVDRISVAFWVATPDLRTVFFVSEGYRLIWGRSREDATHSMGVFLKALHPMDVERVLEHYRSLDDRRPQYLEYRILRPDGEVRWISDRCISLPASPQGRPRIAGMAEDITLRKRAEFERDRFFDLSVDMLCIASLDGYFKRINPSFERTLGYTEQELLGAPFIEFVHPDDRESTIAILESLGEGRDVRQFENRYRCKDGSFRTLAWSTPAPIPGEDSLFAIARDVTDQREAQRALELSEARYRDLFENANDLILTADLEGNFISVNHAGEELMGFSRQELRRMNIADIVTEEEVAKVREMTRRKVETGERTNYELEITAKDGRLLPLEVHSRLIVEGGEPVGIQAIATDITERRRHEQQMLAAKEAAEAANRAKSDFLANMSHEIRTPMNAVIGMTELVLDTRLTIEQREYLATVLESAESLMSLINEILDFSKIESGRIDFDIQPFRLRESLGDTLRWLSLRAQQSELELDFRVQPDVPDFLVGDALRLRQIIINLVGNAIKFTKEGEVSIEVELVQLNAESTELQFTVTDTGIGIPPEKVNQIFRPFEQADASTTRRFGGTGLGLAIAKRLIDLMGGTIWVTSEVGKGTQFFFTLTFQRGKRSNPSRQRGPHDLVGKCVLVVDGTQSHGDMLTNQLAQWGMKVEQADSSSQAFRELENAFDSPERISLVIADRRSANEDGVGLVGRMRADTRFSDTTLILISSEPHGHGKDELWNLKVAATLTRPYTQDELLDAILDSMAGSSFDDDEIEFEETPAEMGTLRILLAEDGLANQKLAVGLLSKWGHQVTLANNGLEAVELFQREPFDLILMDVQMPMMDGLEATRQIRKLEANRDRRIPIVAMTAHALTGDREKCIQAGMDDYVMKPFRKVNLLRALQPFFNLQMEDNAEKLEPRSTENEAIESTQKNLATETEATAPVDAVNEQEPATYETGELLDWTEAVANAGGDRQLLKMVIEVCIAESPELMSQLKEAIASENQTDFMRHAHTIKGSFRHFGETRVGEIAATLEQLGDVSEKAKLERHVRELEVELHRLLEFMKSYEP